MSSQTNRVALIKHCFDKDADHQDHAAELPLGNEEQLQEAGLKTVSSQSNRVALIKHCFDKDADHQDHAAELPEGNEEQEQEAG